MPLTTVTITGADDNTPIEELAAISKEFDFVEWGILIGSRPGTPRFPSYDWIRRLAAAAGAAARPINLSLHVCGRWLREIAAGEPTLLGEIRLFQTEFDRVQLNWHGADMGPIGEQIRRSFCKLTAIGWEPTVIFQMDGVNDGLYREMADAHHLVCAGLFDCSHGAGVVPDKWPERHPVLTNGWAGGLGPHNLEAELKKIDLRAGFRPYWVDMETHVRTSLQLDLVKVRECLAIAQRFMQEELTCQS